MKRNVAKKVFMLFVAMVFCLSVTACNGKTENSIAPTSSTTPTMQMEEEELPTTETPTQSPTQMPMEEPEFQEPTYYYYYAAVQGAVILEQDDTQYFVYCKKCEKCGTVQSNLRHTQYGGNLLTSFYCHQCKEVQQVEIEETMKVIW